MSFEKRLSRETSHALWTLEPMFIIFRVNPGVMREMLPFGEGFGTNPTFEYSLPPCEVKICMLN